MEIGRNKKMREKMVSGKGEAGRKKDKKMREVGDKQEGGLQGVGKAKKKNQWGHGAWGRKNISIQRP